MIAHDYRSPRQPLAAPGTIDHHVSDMTMTASAELTLRDLQSTLATHDQWLPIDGDPQLPLSRLIETNSTGPLRLGYGAWRDLLLGIQIKTTSGKLITAGGRTMKNVAGYELGKFMVGQFGLFGQIVTITTRTYRRPSGSLLVRFDASDRLSGELLPTALRPQWAMLADASLWFGYLGDEKALAFYENQIQSRRPLEVRRQSLDGDINFRARHWLPADRPVVRYRASVPPVRILEFVRRAEIQNYAADAAFGVVVGSCVPNRTDAVRDAAGVLAGTVVFDDPHEIETFFGATGAELQLLKQIKAAFDEQ